ncbi:MAG: M23 family metallopeptidase [Bacteroidales bacterium]|nr:M23 family metallopeptidase [Bacteroidales bacterium]
MVKKIATWAFSIFFSFTCFSQIKSDSYSSPLHIPLFLTGNFGELRANHFHSGLDFKTQGTTGFPVYAFEEGYISRIMYSAHGNGRAIYLNHPNGMTTVYLHLERFTPTLDSMFEEFQYKEENFEVNHYFKENEVRVKKGEIIAYSGNSGSSAGPHLHFEIRDTKTEEVMDPIPYFRNLIKDHVAPQAREVVIYPMFYAGIINGKAQKAFLPVVNRNVRQTPEAWGKIALGIRAFDTKDGVGNVYGVKSVKLFVDNELITDYKIDRYGFKNTRCINSCIDYPEWRHKRSSILKMFVEPGNKIEVYDGLKNGGIIDINEERDYKVKFVLTDEYGNSSELNFTLRGKFQAIPETTIDCRNKLFWDRVSIFKSPKMHLELPVGTLYDDICFTYSIKPSTYYVSDIYSIHTPDVPMNNYCSLEVKVDIDSLTDKSKYFLAKVSGRNAQYQKSEYKNGWVKGLIREFGEYAIAIDQKAPVISPLKMAIGNRLEFRFSDAGSGISSFKGMIDGRFALFELDPKRGVYFCKLTAKRFSKGQNHSLKLVVRDNCQNETTYDQNFHW